MADCLGLKMVVIFRLPGFNPEETRTCHFTFCGAVGPLIISLPERNWSRLGICRYSGSLDKDPLTCSWREKDGIARRCKQMMWEGCYIDLKMGETGVASTLGYDFLKWKSARQCRTTLTDMVF